MSINTENRSARPNFNKQRGLRAVLSAFALAVSGCMLNPVDGQVVSSTSEVINFAGYTNTRSQQVDLEYGLGSSWTEVTGTTTTDTRSLVTSDGVDLFGWSIPTALPALAWSNGTTGRFAKVRMVVPGAGASGSDAYMYTFLSDWSSCHAANPGLGRFLGNCQSPRSPVAYVFTRDYPTGVDLVVTNVMWTSTGRTEVRVRNGGRTGKVGVVSCSRFGSSSTLTINEVIQPGETKRYFSAVAPAGRVTCSVIGTNEDGTPEANISNNQRFNTF